MNGGVDDNNKWFLAIRGCEIINKKDVENKKMKPNCI